MASNKYKEVSRFCLIVKFELVYMNGCDVHGSLKGENKGGVGEVIRGLRVRDFQYHWKAQGAS